MQSLFIRLREPSTWAGFAVLIGSAGHFLPGVWAPVVTGLANAAAGLAVVLREGQK